MGVKELFNYFLELTVIEKSIFILIVLVISIAQYLTLKLRILWSVISIILIHVLVAVFLFRFSRYSPAIHLFYFLPAASGSALLLLFFPIRKGRKKRKISPWEIALPLRRGKEIRLENIKRGLAIFGSAGAGKTESVFVPIIRHAAKIGVTGINYDYKDGELSEIVNFFYQGSKIKTYNIIPHRPEISHRVNPIHPRYIDSPEMVNELVSVLFSNLRKKQSGDKGFFQEVPEATLSAVIWRLKSEFPFYCTLPHAIAICMVKSAKDLAKFIEPNAQSRLMAAPFFDSLEAHEQMAGVKASMSNDLRKFAFPSIFYVLSKSEVDLDINHPESAAMINLVNSPGKENTLSPFLALVFTTTVKLMQQRGRLDSYLLMDEAATLKLPSFSRIPATMRSFNIATIYSLQDKVLGSEQYGDTGVRAILSNLSYQIIGKTNDPESVKYYKQIAEEVEKKQFSKSYGTGFIPKGETRKTESSRETSKYKNQDFFGLNTGEFIVFSDGMDRKVQFELQPFERVSLKTVNHITSRDLDNNYKRILKEASVL